VAQGYSPTSLRTKPREAAWLGRWMAQQGVAVQDLSEEVVARFLAEEEAAGVPRVPRVRSFASLLAVLREEGVIAAQALLPVSPLEALLASYRAWLMGPRGLAEATVLRYVSLARSFLSERVAAVGELGLRNLRGSDVTTFLVRECARLSVGSAKGRVAELRSMLRFMEVEGLTVVGLAGSVPPVAGWRDARVPRLMSASDVQAVLGTCDRTSPLGRRDYAMLMLIARLGLRSVEVARLRLEDVAWRDGTMLVRGKGQQHDRLPLPVEVGEALAAYLSGGRPPSMARHVFLKFHAPVTPILPALVGDVVDRACKVADVEHVGAHQLRHAFARDLLRSGANLKEIAQLLRHRDLATTAVYAKVDLTSLRVVARPWPGAPA